MRIDIDNERESLFIKSISTFVGGLCIVSSMVPISLLCINQIGWCIYRRYYGGGTCAKNILQFEDIEKMSDNVPKKGQSLSRLGAYNKTIPLSNVVAAGRKRYRK